MKELVFCLEELSAQALLEKLIRRILTSASIECRSIVFEGKQDLTRRLPGKLSGYLNPEASFIILRDQDKEDCHQLKAELTALCKKGRRPDAIVRIACRELEAFYIADLAAVEAGLGITGLTVQQNRSKFRSPDQIHSPSTELRKLTRNRYQKVSGSRAIAPHLNLEAPRSKSFHHLLHAIRRAAQKLQLA